MGLLVVPRTTWADTLNACTETNRAKLVTAASKPVGDQRVDLVSSFSRAPAGGPAEIVVAWPFPAANQSKLSYRIAFELGSSESPKADKVRIVENRDISADPVPNAYPLRKAGLVEQGTTLLSFTVPNIIGSNSIFQGGVITVIGCKGTDAEFIGHMSTVYSNRILCILISAMTTLIIYVLIAAAVANHENKIRSPQLSRFRFLDPVVLCSGPNGKGSTSRLQILFFSVLLFALLFYILLRVGLLSDMSETVLLLLGISGVGAAAARGTDTQRKRLKFENWAWLVNKDWLPPNGEASVNVAKWRDVVTGSDGFDVYNFQMLIFSIVVGVALLQVGFTDLAGFVIPSALLAVLGLSQAIYVGGKLTEPASTSDLDAALDKLRTLEDAFAAAAVRIPLPVPAQPNNPPTAAATATPEYRDFAKQRDLVKTMFQSIFGTFSRAPIMEPRYL